MPKVSIIVPVYNGEKHIGKCLDNLINQTFKDIEIIVVNDGSSDNSKQIVEDYINLDDRIKLINFDINKGLYEARYSGYSNAIGDFIVNCDSDDYYSSDAIEVMYNEALNNNADIVVAKLMIVSNGKTKEDTWYNKPNNKMLIGEEILKLLLKNRYNWSMCTKLISRNIINAAINDLPKNKRLLFSEDLLQTSIIYYYSKKLIYSDNAKYFYEIDTSGNSHERTSSNKEIERIKDTIYVLSTINDFLINKKVNNDCYNSFHVLTNFLYSELLFNNSILNNNLKEYLTSLWIENIGFLSISKEYYIDYLYKMDLSSINFSNKKYIKKIKNIGLVYHRLYNGGVERVISKLSHIFNEYGYNIVIFTDEKPNDNDYSLPNNITRVVLSNDNNERYNIFKDNIEKYDIDLIIHNSWMANTLLIDILIIKSIGIKIACILHGVFTVPVYTYDVNKFDRVNLFKLLDYLIVLSNSDKRFYEYFGFNNVYYIPNPLTFTNNSSISNLSTKNIIWVSRFDMYQKQPILALTVFSKVLKNIPDAKLLIIGSGNSYEEGLVKQKIRELKIENNCRLLGYQTNVEKYFLESSIHLFTSSFEGFPMVLNEAKSYGVPTVMFDLPYLEMVKDNMGLITVPQGDVDSLSDAVIKLLLDDEYRVKLGSEAKSSLDKYSDRNIMNYWEKLFYDIENNKSVDRLELDNEVVNVINELVNAVKFEEKILKKEILENKEMIDKLLPTFFALVLYHNYFIIKLFFIKISAKVNKYYEKPVIISLNNLFRNLFYINSDKKYIYIKILFITITFKIK